MAGRSQRAWIDQLGLADRRPPDFYRRRSQLVSAKKPPPHAHTMRRAWDDMGLCGVLCLSQQPAIFMKEVAQLDTEEVRDLHRKLWNHGSAPLLLVIAPHEVHAYSGLAVPAREDEAVGKRDRCVEVLRRVEDALQLAGLVSRVESGDFFRQHHKAFNPSRRVDRCLLRNLDAARKELTEKGNDQLQTAVADAILGRTIFTCYLTDREVIGQGYFEEAGGQGASTLRQLLQGDLRDARDRLYALFERLRRDFNGDVFDVDLDAERRHVTPRHVEILRSLLEGRDLPAGQTRLGFWAYDFGTIPVEMISAIYERFLEAESPEKKRESGAYYTPPELTELALDVALEGYGSLLDKRFLDPACGSGIFLVTLFNRMAEEWSRKHPGAYNLQRADALIELLRRNLFGVDSSETACRIAALSLYLAFLDQLKPRDIQRLKEERPSCLPRLVLSADRRDSIAEGQNILCGDFFHDDTPVPAAHFDVVVGNPPWSRWQPSAIEWCKREGLPTAQKQSAYGFLWKAPRYAHRKGRVCFVLPTGLFTNHQRKALAVQRHLLREMTVDKVVNLSDTRQYLFEGAKHPCSIVRYRGVKPSIPSHVVEYEVPKTEYQTLRAGVFVITAEDRTCVRLREVLHDLDSEHPPLAWKMAMWGGPRDKKLLERLATFPAMEERLDEGGGVWLFKEGFNVGGRGKAIDRPILHKLPFLPTRAVSQYVVPKSNAISRPRTYRPKYMCREDIFRAPHVLLVHGVSTSGGRAKVGFAGFDCSFQHGVRAISGPPEEENALRFVTCVLSSRLALYYFFHTAANWGTERAKIHGEEYRRFPLPRAESRTQKLAFRQVVQMHRAFSARIQSTTLMDDSELEHFGQRIDKLIYQYYDFDPWEQALVDDTVELWIPSATPSRGTKEIPSREPSAASERTSYRRQLVEVLNAWSSISLSCSSIISSATQVGVVVLARVRSPRQAVDRGESTSPDALDPILRRIESHLTRGTRSLLYHRNLKVFDRGVAYVLKPLAKRYWCRTAALNDADEIAAAILG